jgi:hypothetical protein
MDASFFSNPLFWGLIVAAAIAVAWNVYNRASWDAAWARSRVARPKHPEERWSYDANDLEAFAREAQRIHVRRRLALQFYVGAILRGSDTFFAIALAMLTAIGWYVVAVSPMPWTWLNWLALPAGAMAILYGVADIAEDLKLGSLLSNPDKIDPAEAFAANMLTRVKIVTLWLSLLGVLIYVPIRGAQWLLTKALARRADGEVARA